MRDRSRLYADFAKRFAFDRLHGPSQPCDVQALVQVEETIGTYLPVSYRLFLSTQGPLFVPDLWDTVAEQTLAAHPVREFLTAADVLTATQAYWAAGMPRDFVGVAGDFMGKLFGFRRV